MARRALAGYRQLRARSTVRARGGVTAAELAEYLMGALEEQERARDAAHYLEVAEIVMETIGEMKERSATPVT